ncbi:uncharacterized protein V1518DRAFT_413033 [Limtongia smithiae]|uniref:uncharacterized protein n=1 Tax=Limtongia smithiae TaxID=1125753 RepID=UPI0034CD7736
MSRIIVKNLPPTLTDDKLRQHFSEHGGAITDCKLMRLRSGQSRGFGFIGFRRKEDAVEAVKYFDRTYIGMAKIEVGLARSVNDDAVARAEAKRAAAAVAAAAQAAEVAKTAATNKRRKIAQEETSANQDPKLREYLEAMKPRTNERTWANDDDFSVEPVSTNTTEVDETEDADTSKTMSSSQESKKFAPKSKTAHQERNASPVGEPDEDRPNLATTDITDDDWLLARRKRITDKESPAEQETEVIVATDEQDVVELPSEESPESDVADKKEKTDVEINSESIRLTRRLFVRNLSYICSEEDLTELFSAFGPLEEVHIPVDNMSHNSKGFAYIMFKNADEACNAYEELDKQEFQGRLLHILPGKPKRENKLDEFELAKLPLKKQQALKRKALAAKNQFSWSSLYMNADAVVQSLAQQMGVSKSDLLNPESSDAGVRQALAEAHAIEDAKKYFTSVGMDLASFQDPKAGVSDTVILVKNFPFDTSADELRAMFAEYGDVRRVLVPPSNTIAVVEMVTAPQARAAFAKLAYRRLKSAVLYLEKAPKNLLVPAGIPVAPSAAAAAVAKEAKATGAQLVGLEEEAVEDDLGASTSLFIKNLNFKTHTPELTAVFQPLKGFIRAEVKMKKDLKHEGQYLSMGFGFAEFRSRAAADLAMRTMSDFVLDGHKLELKISTRGSTDAQGTQDGKRSTGPARTKIIIKNLPFEASAKDIRQLFGTFGQLRTVRVPKKFDKSARGFAFAEFVSAKEAESAMSSLAGVHLLGRRLVLQYATQDASSAEEEIERMQKKVARQVAGEKAASYRIGGKRKFNIEGDEEGDEE